MSDGIRLQKMISQSGRASRREAERLMLAGRVKVNGTVVTELGTRVRPGEDRVEVDGTPVGVSEKRWLAFHKPPGALTTRSDPHGGRTIYDILPDDAAGLRYVGRLDRDAEGLLLLTNDGDLANALQHPSNEVDREYWLEVAGALSKDTIRRILAGVVLEDGLARPREARLLDSGAVRSTLTLVLTEGRKREVRRLMSEVGHPVMRLRRVRFGRIKLGDLAPGKSRPLSKSEVAGLARVASTR